VGRRKELGRWGKKKKRGRGIWAAGKKKKERGEKVMGWWRSFGSS
jgi:hypothetical protein